MNERITSLLLELRNGLERIYGRRLKNVYLYGSYARGDQDEESDIDVLVVLDRIDRYAQEVNRTGHLISELSLKYEISISRVFVPERDWVHHETLFLSNVRDEAIPA